MSQAQKTPEPGMEDLLASIRKAINAETGAKPQPSSGISGSMREMRVRLEEPQRMPSTATEAEILELRNRIAGHLNERTTPEAGGRPRGFAGILSGETGLPRESGREGRLANGAGREARPAPPAPALRQSYDDPEPELPAEPQPPREDYYQQSYEHRAEVRDEAHDPPQPYEPYRPPSLPELRPRAYTHEAGMLSPESNATTQAAFSRLADTLMSRALGERPIEDITRDLLRSMLKQWLDENLPAMVERLVREEIERVARRGGR